MMKYKSAVEIIKLAQKKLSASIKRIAVIDLDSTLYDVSRRQVAIFKEFAAIKEYQLQFPKETEVLSKMSSEKLAYYPVDCLHQAGLSVVHPEFSKIYHAFWSKRFFSNDYLIYDELEKGAKEFIAALVDSDYSIVYLTGRDVARMGKGTRAQLERDHLLDAKKELILKPHLSEEDHLFKLRVAKDLCAQPGTGLLFIDNEANNINHIHTASLPVLCVFFDTVHSGKAEPIPEIPVMRSFVL